MLIEVSQQVQASPAVVWDVLTDWERQPDWMIDAKAVEVLSADRTGVGVTIRCPTNLLGVTVQDIMRVTAWEEQRRLEIVHLGSIITGTGAFLLAPAAGGTQVTWVEEIDPPLGRLGALGARMVVAPFTRRLFARSLANLAAVCERAATRGR